MGPGNLACLLSARAHCRSCLEIGLQTLANCYVGSILLVVVSFFTEASYSLVYFVNARMREGGDGGAGERAREVNSLFDVLMVPNSPCRGPLPHVPRGAENFRGLGLRGAPLFRATQPPKSKSRSGAGQTSHRSWCSDGPYSPCSVA